MSYRREHCILCLGHGFLYVGDNLFSEVKMKKLACPHCEGQGMIAYEFDEKNERFKEDGK